MGLRYSKIIKVEKEEEDVGRGSVEEG